MANTQQLTAWLTEAQNAYHELVSGIAPKVIVHQNGQRVEYNSTTRNALKSYIEELKIALGQTSNMLPPMRVYF